MSNKHSVFENLQTLRLMGMAGALQKGTNGVASCLLPVNDFHAEGRVKRVYRSGSWKTFSYDARGNMARGDGLTSATYNAMDTHTNCNK
ncbi:hypothetical protein [Pseudoalteromonas sp. ASV78]|uniref:hypothetical protein n=1 Tax=Pseudoalteromonas sp. ASV78 TaxID=3397851 RepID=UPI0039FD1057